MNDTPPPAPVKAAKKPRAPAKPRAAKKPRATPAKAQAELDRLTSKIDAKSEQLDGLARSIQDAKDELADLEKAIKEARGDLAAAKRGEPAPTPYPYRNCDNGQLARVLEQGEFTTYEIKGGDQNTLETGHFNRIYSAAADA